MVIGVGMVNLTKNLTLTQLIQNGYMNQVQNMVFMILTEINGEVQVLIHLIQLFSLIHQIIIMVQKLNGMMINLKETLNGDIQAIANKVQFQVIRTSHLILIVMVQVLIEVIWELNVRQSLRFEGEVVNEIRNYYENKIVFKICVMK